MNLSFAVYRRLTWINLPAALLIALLQRTPIVRVLASAGNQVAVSPAAQLLRGVLTAAAVGAMHSRAGATTFILSPSSPIQGRVGTPVSAGFSYTGTPSAPASFQIKSGSLPPGVNFNPPPVSGTIRSGAPGISGTPTQAGTFTVMVQGFNAEGLTNNIDQAITFEITGGVTATAPSITSQPANQAVTVGGSVTFSVTASGEPTPTYQWRRNGTNIVGATSATLQLTNVQTSDAGTYSVVISNSAGSIASSNVTLTVNPPVTAIAITAQPVSQTVAAGSTVVFNATVTGATSLQWRRNGTDIGGATTSTLVIRNATAADAGNYVLVAAGSGGAASVTSAPAALVVNTDSNFGRLINLSILTSIPTAGANFTMGYVVGGDNTTGAKPLVIRAVGPSLGALGVPGTLADPRMELFSGSEPTPVVNDNWGGSVTVSSAMAAVGAFPFTNTTSLDAALVANVTTRANSVRVSANGNGTGTVIAEIYDGTPAGSFGATVPRLINVSVNKILDASGANAKLTAGFVIGGATARTVLVRAVGPGLGAFGVTGFLADPQLALFAGSTKTAENDNWGGDAQITTTATSVGAFGLPATSRDAVLLVTLSPGQYSAEVTGANGGGLVLVEVYEVP